MKWIDASVELAEEVNAEQIMRTVERACRTCYQSQDLIGDGSAEKLIRSCVRRGHESVLEHEKITFRVVCDRAVSHEIVRHRIAAYSQESQRYCTYNKEKFGGEITYIYPFWFPKELRNAIANFEPLTLDEQDTYTTFSIYQEAAQAAETAYFDLLNRGLKPEAARGVLPNCVKTELTITMNLRELRHFIKLRSSMAAHPDIRALALQLLALLRKKGLGVFFEDIDEV